MPSFPAGRREPAEDLRVWYLTTGDAGTREQARGLATALATDAEERVVRVSRLWAAGPAALVGVGPPAVTPVIGELQPPWPDVLVSCGRRSGLVSMAIRRRNAGRMLAVHLQPPTHPKAFDLVVAMSHDRLEGPNVLRVDTALHGITPAVLAAAATHHDDRFKSLPRPWTGVLLGGATRHKPFSSEDAMRLAHQLDLLRAHIGGSLLLTPSRRTPADVLAAFAARYLRDQTVWIWAGDPPNPYIPLLARSDRLVVTSDSISMISEALATTAPISIFHVAGGARHERFVQNLIAKQLVFPLEAEPPMTARTPIDATPLVAELVRQRFSRLQ